jgi:4,5-DOPA dioxygenase extradiol
LQLSIDKNKSPKDHYEMAKKIRSLRKKGVLIIGSDNIVHNLMINWNKNAKPYNWAISFNNAIKKAIQDKDHNKIVDYAKIEGAKDSVPTSEHFIPLIYILALKGDEEKVSFFNDEIEMGSLSMTSILIN